MDERGHELNNYSLLQSRTSNFMLIKHDRTPSCNLKKYISEYMYTSFPECHFILFIVGTQDCSLFVLFFMINLFTLDNFIYLVISYHSCDIIVHLHFNRSLDSLSTLNIQPRKYILVILY